MNQLQLFTAGVRILGVYLLVEAVMQVPAGIVDGIAILLYGLCGSGPTVFVAQFYLPVFTALLGFVIYLAAGWYLVKGAPHLVRVAGFTVGDRQSE